MQKDTWKRRIRKSMQEAGTYQPYFEYAIDTLAGILETRDDAQRAYEQSGRQPVVIHVNKGGNSNIAKNPVLVVVENMNAQALVYWKELGLTPKGLKAINEKAMKTGTKKNTLGDALRELGI